jgi:hypothetical protein
MDIFKMSKNEKVKDFMKKSVKIRLVTKMLRKIFFVKKKCYDTFFLFLLERLRHFFCQPIYIDIC